MRLVSWNIQYLPREPQKILKERVHNISCLLNSLHPDVVALQEVSPAAWPLLQETVSVDVAEITPREDGRLIGEGVPVFTTGTELTVLEKRSFWFSDTPELPSRFRGSVHPRVCSAIRLKQGEVSFWIFNLHLDHRSLPSRKKSLKVLNRMVSKLVTPEEQVIVCGDFNMPGRHPAVTRFRQESPHWVDAASRFPEEALKPTYLGWGPMKFAKARIDLCFHSPEIQIQRYQALNPVWKEKWISDHRLMIIDFTPR